MPVELSVGVGCGPNVPTVVGSGVQVGMPVGAGNSVAVWNGIVVEVGDAVGIAVSELVSPGVWLGSQVQVGSGDEVSLCLGVLVRCRISVEVEEGTGLGSAVQGSGVAERATGVKLSVGEGDGVQVWVAGKVGGERSSLPGEGEDLSRQSPA